MATTEATQGVPVQESGWQEIRRRRPYPANWRSSQPTEPTTKPYQPYPRPTYAQVLLRNTSPSTMATQTQPRSTPPASPKFQIPTTYYVSPHSPSRLRFPPSHTFAEWRGRCFRCCRTGHSAAKCRNPKRCGRCWSYGHIGSKCNKEVVPPPPPIKPLSNIKPARQYEPGFEELLDGSYPSLSPEMPKERPMRVHCFIEKDEEYYAELERLKRAVVMHTKGFQWELSVDNVASYACRTKLVQKDEIQVSQLSGSRFLILLPEGLDPDTFINATPQEAWDEGLSFQPWSPLEDAGISIPSYKVLLRLVGTPPHLCREKNIIQAVSRFGVFLGSVQPENPSSLASWLVAVGVDDLTLIPPEVVMHIGGVTHDVLVHTLAYKRSPLYTTDDLPKHPKVYKRPQPPPSSTSSSDDENMHDEHELIPMSSKVLREICRGKTADSLPPELRRFATMEEIVLQHPDTATRDHATKDPNPANQDSLINSNNAQIDTQKTANLLAINDTSNNEMDPMISRDVTASPTNIDSSGKSVLHLAVSSNQDVASHSRNSSSPSQLGPAQLLPQKILLRGSSSGNNSMLSRDPRERISRRVLPTPTANSIMPPIPKMIPDSIKLDAPSSRLEREATVVFQAKNKGPIKPSFKGPFADKYKWKKPLPSNAAQIKISKEPIPLKRKNQAPPMPGPVKKISGKGKGKKEGAEVSLNSSGFFEVKVQYEQISKLAEGCGFKVKDVEEVIRTDNAERQAQAAQTITVPTTVRSLNEEDLDLGRFDLDSGDELPSDEEGC